MKASFGHVKSVDFSTHGAITGPLTDRQIDKYAILGKYGEARQQQMLDLIREGKLRSYDALIKKGHLGLLAQKALSARPQRKKRAKKIPADALRRSALTQEQIDLYESIGIEIYD